MKANVLQAIEEMKEALMNGWSVKDRETFNDYLEVEIKPYFPNLYLLLSGNFEAELQAMIDNVHAYPCIECDNKVALLKNLFGVK